MTDSTNPRVMADNIKELLGGQSTQGAEMEALDDKIVALQIYDDDETDTGKKWLDGKPIYRKVFPITAFPNNTSEDITHGLTLDTVITLFGVMQCTNVAYGKQFTVTGVSVEYSNNVIRITTNADYSARKGFILMEYTKATPTPDVSPAPDSRSLEEPETEPESDEPINEEPKKEEK